MNLHWDAGAFVGQGSEKESKGICDRNIRGFSSGNIVMAKPFRLVSNDIKNISTH